MDEEGYTMRPAVCLSDAQRLERTELPAGRLPVVLDTDAYNEIDDQFAILYALLSPQRIDLQAVYAAPFYNERSSSPEDGMEKSHREILQLLAMAGVQAQGLAFKGCRAPLADTRTPQEAPAVHDLVSRARSRPKGSPLIVVSIGACTNVASALLAAPDIIDKIVLVPLLANSPHWHCHREFNLENDIHAAQVLFGSGAPIIQVPANGVTGFLLTCEQELDAHLGGKNALCDYLVEAVREHNRQRGVWGKPIWDVGPIGMLVEPARAVMRTMPAPVVHDNGMSTYPVSGPLIRCVCALDRDAIFRDMFGKLAAAPL